MRLFLVLITLVFCSGCGHRNTIPAKILSPDQMRHIIWDMMRSDAYVNEFIVNDSSKNVSTESIRLYEEVFRLHHTNGEAFRKSLAFYEDHPDLFKIITDSLRVDGKKALEEPPPPEIKSESDTVATKPIKPVKDSILKRRSIIRKALQE